MGKEVKPLYRSIFEQLKRQIDEGRYVEDQQVPTEAELSETYRVSRITSKRALEELEREGLIYRKQGSGSFVKPKGGLFEASEQEGRPKHKSGMLPAPSSGIGHVAALVIPGEESNGLSGYIRGAGDYLDSKGLLMTIHTTGGNPAKERELLETLPGKGISAILLYPVEDRANLEQILSLAYNDYPLIAIDKYYDGLPVSSVVSDNEAGGRIVTDRLLALGHKRIAFLSGIGIEAVTSVRNRFMGYCQSLRAHGIPVDTRIVKLDFGKPFSQGNPFFHRQIEQSEEGKRFLKRMLEGLMALGVTAIQAENDLLAIGLLKTAADLGIKVPEALSVAGFDNVELSGHLDIPLTTVEQPFYETGRKAAELAVRVLRSGPVPIAKLVLPVALIERQSIGPAPAERGLYSKLNDTYERNSGGE
ncbi:GntR family transcriptional regulator [Paenibacillus sp. MBLB4367]|uniref:GntR family transcriptional regulator n=1 Tax=Paenibacillus sp. MBLB4367 TaxID=3384767 RepID=UPI003907F0BD